MSVYDVSQSTVNPRRPSLERTISSPPSSPMSLSKTSKLDYLLPPSSLKTTAQLTPPTSPKLVRSNTSLAHNTMFSASSSHLPTPSAVEENANREELPWVIQCPFEVDIAKDHLNRPQLFGQGAWSNVYRGLGRSTLISLAQSTSNLPTPPPSPQASVPLLVAVKAPITSASRTILYNEAVVLTHLTRTPNHEKFIVNFYGYIPSSAALVLAPVPLSLSDHITANARLSRSKYPEVQSTEPVLGSISTWLDLAAKLVTALAWLHNEALVVHGDIKPGNILLSTNLTSDRFPFQPLLIDFSSSHILSSTSPTSNTLSALTREYTAPELLSTTVLRDPSSTATTASDVFSLAVTLTVAATGELMVYRGNVWQRQYMSQQGWNILEFVRSGEEGMRVPRGGIVERVVEAAVAKVDQGRIDAGRWRDLVRAVMRDEAGFQQRAAAEKLGESMAE